MAVWPVFLPIAMYQDHGNRFAIGDAVSWDVLLVDGDAGGWPAERLVAATARIAERPWWATRGSLADTGTLRIGWSGSEPAGSLLALKAGLVADFWNPAIPTMIGAAIRGIEVVSWRAALDPSGVWTPLGPWRLTPVRRTPPLLGFDPRDPGSEHAGGLLFTTEVSSSAVRTGAETGRGIGDPAPGPGIERTRPRRPSRSG